MLDAGKPKAETCETFFKSAESEKKEEEKPVMSPYEQDQEEGMKPKRKRR